MNKTDLVKKIAETADISQAAADRALFAITESIAGALAKGESVSLVNFGTFEVRKREARAGRNPQTGETIQIAAAKLPAFKAGKGLKDAVNG
jgi:DNA-binding protein HU-beta